MTNCEYMLQKIACKMKAAQSLSWILMKGGAIQQKAFGRLLFVNAHTKGQGHGVCSSDQNAKSITTTHNHIISITCSFDLKRLSS